MPEQRRMLNGDVLRWAWLHVACATAAVVLASRAGATIQFGQIDDFQDGTTMSWQEGGASPNPPMNVGTGGPAGAGDKFLSDFSSGAGGAGARQIFFNQSQWVGDYTAAHVTRLQGKMINLGSTTLYMRVAFQGIAGTVASSSAITLLPGSGWQPVTFDLTGNGMSALFGGSVPEILSDVFDARILSSQFGGAIQGDSIASTVGLDNLRALTIPGDANFDGFVNAIDFNALAGNFAATGQSWITGDFDFNGTVNAPDFNLLAANFNQNISPPAPGVGVAVPEPTILGLALLTLLAGARNRRRLEHPRILNP